MTAREIIHCLHEHKPAPNWTNTKGVYGDYSRYPDIQFYCKCPKCALVHGSYKNMREAHSKRLCDRCNIEAINKTKKLVKEVDAPKNRGKPGKSLSKVFNEAAVLPAPGEYPVRRWQPVRVTEADEMLPPPPGDAFDARDFLLSTPFGSWISIALYELGNDQGTEFTVSPDFQSIIDEPDSAAYCNVEGNNNTEWTIYKSEDEAREAALERVRQDLRHEPENYFQPWLQNHINLERLKNHLREEAREIEWLLDMEEEEQVAYLIKAHILSEENFYNEEGDFVPNEDLLEAGLEIFRNQKEAEFDPLDFLRDIYGKEEYIAKAIEIGGINIDAAAEDAVQIDGWAHFMNTYDGGYTDLTNGAVAFRTN